VLPALAFFYYLFSLIDPIFKLSLLSGAVVARKGVWAEDGPLTFLQKAVIEIVQCYAFSSE
jgi:hypothetical protein